MNCAWEEMRKDEELYIIKSTLYYHGKISYFGNTFIDMCLSLSLCMCTSLSIQCAVFDNDISEVWVRMKVNQFSLCPNYLKCTGGMTQYICTTN